MTYKQAQQKADDLTEKDSQQYNKEWLAIYTALGVTLSTMLAKYYTNYNTGENPTDYYAISQKRLRGGTYKGKTRLYVLQSEIANTYSTEKNKINNIVIKMSKINFSNSFYRQLYLSQWGADVSFNKLEKEVIDWAVLNTEEAWNGYLNKHIKKYGSPENYLSKEGTLIDRLRRGKTDELSKLNSIITNGVRSGKSVPKLTNEIIDQVIGKEIRKAGKVALSRAKATTARLVRTEMNRLVNAGHFAQSKYIESLGIDVRKVWDAFLDNRTRPSHGELDQTEKKIDEVFRIGTDVALYPGDFGEVKNNANCRCRYSQTLPGLELETRRARPPAIKNQKTGKYEIQPIQEISFTTWPEWAKDNNLIKYGSGLIA